ncbi:LysM peptidoglycan-binding domain-containing protein [Actinospica robiniae]|uniref:LysM peptidoglycan-binding domain-containing protein n=1 Tax=Actinospica robiniae TaxID=304901 RepID=UPI000414349B|nr:LysM peptidoglycan-binding domain-containing protein [Actinospica robiniae]
MTQPTRASIMRPLLRDTAVAIAVPTALYLFVGSPLPLRLPSTDMLVVWWNTLQADPTEAIHPLLTAFVYLVWIAWIWHALWTATALIWITLRLPAVALPAALQRLTPAAAVQALALGSMLTTQTAHAAAATDLAASITHVHAELESTQRLPSQHRHHEQQAAPVTYTVQPGDTLWSIAEQQLGDGRDWTRVFKENEHIPQSAGGELADPGAIDPGWTLVLPTAAGTAGTEIAPAPTDAVPSTRAPTRPHGAAPAISPHTPHVAPRTPGTHAKHAAPGNTATAPATAHDAAPTNPSPTRPWHAPAPTTPAPRAATPAVPHTAGWTLPGGYLGITLLSAIAAACTVLVRKRTKNSDDATIPASVRALASAARSAHASASYGYLPEEQAPGATPPPLFTPKPGAPILGLGPDQSRESAYDPENLKLLALTGPGALEAASALMLSILAADTEMPLFPGLEAIGKDKARSFRVVTDDGLARELLGPIEHVDVPGWLLLTPTTDEAALAAVLPNPNAAAPGHTATATSMATVLFTPAAGLDLARTIKAIGTAPAPLAVVVLSQTAIGTADLQTITQARVAADGQVTESRGPAAAQFAGLRLQTLHRDLAGEIYHVLRNARTPHHQARHASETGGIGSTASEEDDVAAQTIRVPVQATKEREPERPRNEQPEAPPLMLRILGPIEIQGPAGTVPVTGDKTAALLALLAVYPRGRTIAQVADQAWDGLDVTGTDATPIRSAIARARTLLRGACHENPPGAELITAGPLGFRLNPRWITTDFAALESIERAVRHTRDPALCFELLQEAAGLCRGELAEALDDWDRDWLTTARIAYDRQAAALASELTEMEPARDHSALII